MIIAVDFDGTIVRHRFPEMGELYLYAFEVLSRLQKKGHKIILWTCRDNDYLYEAIKFCRDNHFLFDAINYNVENINFGLSKIYADIYIDDRGILGLPMYNGEVDWLKIEQIINEKETTL